MKKLMTEWRKAKKALLTEAAPWPAEGGESLEATMRGIMNNLGRVEVNDKVWRFLIQQIKKSIAKKEIDGYPKLKDAMVIFTDALMPKHVKKGTKKASAADAAGKGGGRGPGKRHNVTVRNGKCLAKGKSLGDVSGAQATPADFAKCKAANKRRGMTINCRSAARAAAQNRACAALANKT